MTARKQSQKGKEKGISHFKGTPAMAFSNKACLLRRPSPMNLVMAFLE